MPDKMSEYNDDSLPPFTVAKVSVINAEQISPTFVRVVFGGPELNRFGNSGRTFDQRIKIVFPVDRRRLPDLRDSDPDWYGAWRALPAEERGVMRTYSIRHLTRDDRGTTVTVDFVLHASPGASGPAADWAKDAQPGKRVILIGPRRDRFEGGGVEFYYRSSAPVLLAGDETAAPAIARILEDADPTLRGLAFIEVPTANDQFAIQAPAGIMVRWLERGQRAHGDALTEAVLANLGVEQTPTSPDSAAAGHDSDSLIWEASQYSNVEPATETKAMSSEYSFWIAGESGLVTSLRRYLVDALRVDRAQIAFMGYWKRGVAMQG